MGSGEAPAQALQAQLTESLDAPVLHPGNQGLERSRPFQWKWPFISLAYFRCDGRGEMTAGHASNQEQWPSFHLPMSVSGDPVGHMVRRPKFAQSFTKLALPCVERNSMYSRLCDCVPPPSGSVETSPCTAFTSRPARLGALRPEPASAVRGSEAETRPDFGVAASHRYLQLARRRGRPSACCRLPDVAGPIVESHQAPVSRR